MTNIEMLSETTLDELRFTEQEIHELEKARSMPIVFDEDCPKTTPEKALKFRRVNPPRTKLI